MSSPVTFTVSASWQHRTAKIALWLQVPSSPELEARALDRALLGVGFDLSPGELADQLAELLRGAPENLPLSPVLRFRTPCGRSRLELELEPSRAGEQVGLRATWTVEGASLRVDVPWGGTDEVSADAAEALTSRFEYAPGYIAEAYRENVNPTVRHQTQLEWDVGLQTARAGVRVTLRREPGSRSEA